MKPTGATVSPVNALGNADRIIFSNNAERVDIENVTQASTQNNDTARTLEVTALEPLFLAFTNSRKLPGEFALPETPTSGPAELIQPEPSKIVRKRLSVILGVSSSDRYSSAYRHFSSDEDSNSGYKPNNVSDNSYTTETRFAVVARSQNTRTFQQNSRPERRAFRNYPLTIAYFKGSRKETGIDSGYYPCLDTPYRLSFDENSKKWVVQALDISGTFNGGDLASLPPPGVFTVFRTKFDGCVCFESSSTSAACISVVVELHSCKAATDFLKDVRKLNAFKTKMVSR